MTRASFLSPLCYKMLQFYCLIVLISNLTFSVHANYAILRSLDTAPVSHFTLNRRGGPFMSTEGLTDVVDLTHLESELAKAEGHYNLTKREVKGNRVVRVVKTDGKGGQTEGRLMGDVANTGTWYAMIKIGDPPQEIEMDLNMLASDFYVIATTSQLGSKYDDYFSQSSVKSNERPYPTCGLPTDLFYLPTINTSLPLSFAYCRPSKFSQTTLGPSGSTLGLAPSEQLSQTGSMSILKQLFEEEVIQRSVFSLMLINSHEGVLSIGGTAAAAVQMVVTQMRAELDHLGAIERGEEVPSKDPLLAKRGKTGTDVVTRATNWEAGWVWSNVRGADGWWQTLMQSVWVDGSKVLKNQGVVIDINSPFVMAPPLAAKTFYASVSGSYPLPPPHSNFYAFPCLNPPKVAFEFSGKKFPFMHSPRCQFGECQGHPGGRFSLGRLKIGSGYCVGAVVETRMGLEEEEDEVLDEGRRGTRLGADPSNVGGNGMRDVWVIGEGFFRGVGGVFDFKEHRAGFRVL